MNPIRSVMRQRFLIQSLRIGLYSCCLRISGKCSAAKYHPEQNIFFNHVLQHHCRLAVKVTRMPMNESIRCFLWIKETHPLILMQLIAFS